MFSGRIDPKNGLLAPVSDSDSDFNDLEEVTIHMLPIITQDTSPVRWKKGLQKVSQSKSFSCFDGF